LPAGTLAADKHTVDKDIAAAESVQDRFCPETILFQPLPLLLVPL